MSKNKKLIQNVDVFHKLALFGDRSSFLKSLAQDILVNFPHDTLSGLFSEIATRANALARDWESADKASGPQANNLKDYARAFEKASIPSYFSNRAALDEKVNDVKRWASIMASDLAKAPAQLSSQVKSLQDALSRIEQNVAGFYRNVAGLPYSGEPSKAPTDTATPVATQTDNKPAAQRYPNIPRDIQDLLNQILVPAGLIVPIKTDGSLGPDTQKAIETFRKQYNVPGNFSLPEVFEVIRNTAVRQ